MTQEELEDLEDLEDLVRGVFPYITLHKTGCLTPSVVVKLVAHARVHYAATVEFFYEDGVVNVWVCGTAGNLREFTWRRDVTMTREHVMTLVLTNASRVRTKLLQELYRDIESLEEPLTESSFS